MPMLQYVSSLFRHRAHALRRDRVPPHHPVGFGLFLRYTHGFRSRCSLHTVAIICRLAMRRGSQIPLAMLALQIPINRPFAFSLSAFSIPIPEFPAGFPWYHLQQP